MSGNTTLYAKWTADTPAPKTYVITFHPNGGSGGGERTTGTDGKLSALPARPTRSGYIFDGWYTARTGGTEVSTATVFTANTTVYAGWSRASAARYRIYTPSRTPGGSFSVSHTSAAQGTRVTIGLSPRRDFELDLLAVTNLDTNREVRLTRRSSDEYTFTMPDSDVEVEITFEDTYSDSRSDPAPAAPQVQDRPAKWYYQNGVICHVVTGAVPTGTVLTRDMLVSVLYNLDPASSGEPSFWATSNAVVPDIYRSALYGVDKPVSREQTAMILFCYARYRGCGIHQRANLTGYADYGRIQEIARPAMSWARATGVIAGTSATRLSPQNYLTCGQAGTILSRFTTNVLWAW